MLQIRSLSKSFGSRVLFRDVKWFIGPLERVGLVGPNGTGKTTLLRMLAGTEPVDGGEISKPRDLTIGYLAQDVRIAGHKSALAHVAAGDEPAREAQERLESITRELEGSSAARLRELTEAHATAVEDARTYDAFTLDARARTILAGLGFAPSDVERPLEELSGGWAMRAELARLLLSKPALLLLDEPTNHLDLESIEWLEQFLDSYEGAWVIVSHDRTFLNRMVDRVAELSSDGLHVFEGSYDDYVEARDELNRRLAQEASNREKRISEVERFVERFRAQATKARQAQSRVKLLDKLKAKAEASSQPKAAARQVKLNLPAPQRAGDPVLRMEGVSKSFGDKKVYAGLDAEIRRGEKIALVGPNGAGKSTLMKLMAGVLEADGGDCVLGHNVTRFYFAQHQSEVLNPDATIVEELRRVMPDAPESRVRGVAGAFLFVGDDADKPIRVLSGGERARVALALMLAEPANLLLLDEPTNHLDVASRDVLEHALSEFPGTVILISHDRYFINRVATSVLEIRPGGATRKFLGNYDYYAWKRAEEERERAQAEAFANSTPVEDSSSDYKKRKEEKRRREKLKRDLEALEANIAAGESRLSEIDALLAQEEVFSDAERCQKLGAERVTLTATLGALLERWESVSIAADEA